MTTPVRARGLPRHQRGVAAVEFALVATVLCTLLFGAIEVGRVLWLMNAASEATRLGARLAVVCDLNEANIALRMKDSLGLGDTSLIGPVITYEPSGCTSATCESVTVSLAPIPIPTFVPIVNFEPTMPPFRTTLSRESMSSANNSVCS